MAHCYSHYWDPGAQKKSWVQTQWRVGEIPAGYLLLGLPDLGSLPTACQWGLLLCALKKHISQVCPYKHMGGFYMIGN
jgi:hypothetical protein